MILLPLIYTEALPPAVIATILVAPLPPRAVASIPPRRAAKAARVINLSQLKAPASIPQRIYEGQDNEKVIYDDFRSNTPEEQGNPLTNIIGSSAAPIPKAPATETKRIRVGTMEEASLLNKVLPEYPAIAKTARISGTIVLRAIIAADGSVRQLEYVSGPPLLMKAALDAVRQWRYKPLLLDGAPVEVDTTISVVFRLGN